MPGLRQLLEARIAIPADFAADDESLLVSSNLTGILQLFRVPRGGGELEQLTDQREPVGGFFLPGTERVLLSMDTGGNELQQLYLVDAIPRAELEPFAVASGFFHRHPQVTPDGRLLAYSSNSRNGVDHDVLVRDLESGEERRVFDAGGWCQAAGFSPGGTWLAVLRETERSGDNELWLVEVETGERFEAVPHADASYVGPPAWISEDSFSFACSVDRDTAGVARYDVGSRTWESVLESGWDAECTADRQGRRVLVEWNEDGYSRLELLDGPTLQQISEVPLPGRGVASDFVFSRDGALLAYHFTSPLEPGDVWVYDLEAGGTARLTRSPGAPDREELVEPELHRFSSFDGESVPVYLYRPESEGPAPVVIAIHGGPEAQLRPVWSPLSQYFVSHGYAVAGPNVRGSTGYGKRYEHLDDVRLRLDSVQDLVGLHDWLGTMEGVDPGRAVLYGGSYGGYMVLAGLAFFPDRWAAGIEVVGISSLVTFLENTAEWRRAFREREYGSLEHDRDFLREISPLSRVEQIRVPLFVIHGANDPRVPLGEAQQIHGSLTERGVRCELLVYDDEGHGLARLSNRLDAYPKAVAFLEEVLAVAPAEVSP